MNLNKRKIPRSQWLTALLLAYLVLMTGFFAKDLIRNGETARLIVVVCSELLIITILYFFLKKREEQQNK